jgi:multidrug resistance protein, MATE family
VKFVSAKTFRALFSLALPTIGLNILTVLALAVDTAMCGRLPQSELVLTGLGFATQTMFLVYIAMVGLSVGTVALVARYHGANQPDQVNHVLWQSTMVTALTAVFVAVVGNLFADPILSALGADGAVRAAALEYFRPILSATILTYLMVLYGAALRGVGNTRLPFAIGLVSNALNVLLNYGLILGNWGLPALGLTGAAIGTIVSSAVGLVLMVLALVKRVEPGLTLRPMGITMDRQVVRRMVQIGGPAALDMVILNAAFLSIVGMLGRLEPVAVAAHGIGLRIQSLAFVPGLAVAQATAAMVGNALGAGSIAEAKRILRASIFLTVGIMVAIGATILIWTETIVGLFDVELTGRLFELADVWIQLLGCAMPIVGLYIAYVGLLQGSGATWISLRINALSTLLFQIPLSGFLGFVVGWGPFGVWVAFPLAFVLKATLVTKAFQDGRWAKVGTFEEAT